MIKIGGLDLSEASSLCYCDRRTAADWIRRFDENGLAGLKDRPRSGWPPKVEPEKVENIIEDVGGITTPGNLQNDIRERFKVRYHITNVRKIMHRRDMSAKRSQRIHVSRADPDEIRRWQQDTKEQISRLEQAGFVTAVLDEAIFVHDTKNGAKYWSRRGVAPVVTAYKGGHGRIVAYGAITTDNRQFVRTYKKFDKEAFLKYPKALIRHFGRVTLILDNAPQHKARILLEYLEANRPNVKIIWLPTATPELSVVEEYWHQSKRNLLVGEYYSTIVQMRHTMSEYFRTARPKLDAMKFIARTSLPCKNF